MATPAPANRVLAFARRLTDSSSVPMHFTQSVLDYFGDEGTDMREVFSHIESGPTRLVISSVPNTPNDKAVRLKRPSFCPVHNLLASQHSDLDPAIYNRGVDTGAVILLESADNRVLLIRRAKHLRTFPNIWVPPGGHIEQGETVSEAGLRELKEETGIDVSPSMLESQIATLCLWESCFPPKLSAGLPKRHHIVVYLHCKLKEPHTSNALQGTLKPDPTEVGACAWVDQNIIAGIVSASEESTVSAVSDAGYIRAQEVSNKGLLSPIDVPLAVLFAKSSGEKEDIERVSTGTKWALENWLRTVSE